jgi:hypothetical protein
MKDSVMEDLVIKEKVLEQGFEYQGKNQQASQHWFDLITQITLDYRRLNTLSIAPVQEANQSDVLILEGEIHTA